MKLNVLFIVLSLFLITNFISSYSTTTLRDENLADDYYSDDDPITAVNTSTQIKWNLSSVALQGRTLLNATLCLYAYSVGGTPDDDANVTRILDWVWTESSSLSTINSQAKGVSKLLTLNSTSVNSWSCLNVTDIVSPDFNNYNNSVTMRIFDPDYPAPGSYDIKGEDVGGGLLAIGNSTNTGTQDEMIFRDREYSTDATKRPSLLLNYLFTPPTANILYPTTSLNLSSGTNIHLNFSITNWTTMSTCLYSLDNYATNTTISGCVNTTFSTTEGSKTLKLWVNDSDGNSDEDSVTFTVDTTYPLISILYPVNNTNSSDYGLQVNFTATDTNRASCWWSDDNGITNTSNPTCLNLTGSWVEGLNKVILWVNDSAGNTNSTQISFTIDATYPLIDYGLNTENNNTNFSRTWLYANVSVTETNEKNITFTLFNQTSQVNSTTYTTAIRSINWTTLPSEIYYYNVTICDIVNQCNSTSTRKLTLDTTNPLISFGTMPETNNTNFSRTYIQANVSITDTNFKNVTFYLYNTSLVNSTTYTDSTRQINWTNLANGLYYYNATTYDYAGNSNSTETRWIRLDTTAPVITLYDPDPITYSDNESIPLNFTAVDATLSVANCWYRVTNLTTVIISNTTLTNCQNSTFDVPRADNYNFTLWANDTLGQTNIVEVDFEVDLTAPGISLDYPASYANLSSSTTQVNFTATDSDGISQCQLWSNFTGAWALNETFTSVTSGVTKSTSKTLSDNYYLWGLWCNDTSNNANWVLNNQTFTIDTVYPTVAIDSITTTIASQTISFNSSASDTHLKSCKFSIYNLAGGIDGANENVSISCNTNPHSATVSGFATYTLKVYSDDYSGNENSTNLSFTTSASSGATILGGGGSTSTEETPDLGFCGDKTCNKDRGESFYNCPEDCSQLSSLLSFENFNLDKLVFNCVDDDKTNECFWTSNPGWFFLFISIALIFLFSLLFDLKPNKTGTKRLVYVGPRKKKRR